MGTVQLDTYYNPSEFNLISQNRTHGLQHEDYINPTRTLQGS